MAIRPFTVATGAESAADSPGFTQTSAGIAFSSGLGLCHDFSAAEAASRR
jgi:hypothetical protein